MILGQQQDTGVDTTGSRVNFTPPAGSGYIPGLPATGWYSGNFHPFSQVLRRTAAYPAYMPPLPPNTGPQALPPIAPPTPPTPTAAVPPPGSGMHGAGAFGVSGFGSNGGVRGHSHVSPYMTMRTGTFPGIDPSGANIRAGYENAGARIQRSLPFQSMPFAPDAPPPVTAPPAGPGAPAPSATHGFGRHIYRRSAGYHHMTPRSMLPVHEGGCEWVGPRLDGSMVQICDGRVTAYRDSAGNVVESAYLHDAAEAQLGRGWFRRNFGWRRH